MVAWFVGNQSSAYYQSPLFGSILQNISRQPSRMRVKEQNHRLSLVAQRTASIEAAKKVMEGLWN
jgi:hypothetical protein